MAYYYTSDDLISSVKRRASIPDNQNLISDSEILKFANEELMLNLCPFIMSKHEDYFVVSEDVNTTDDEDTYAIPYRAMGASLKDLYYVDGNDNLTHLNRIAIGEIASRTNNYGRARGFHYYIVDESIKLEDSAPYEALRFFYSIRPNQLVDSDRVSMITAINSDTGVITVSSIPSNFSANSTIDFIKTKSPHRIISYDISATVDSNLNTFTISTDDLPASLSVGDRICLQNETDLVNIPAEFHVMLAEQVASRVMEEIADYDGLKASNDKLDKMEKRAEILIDNRIKGSPIKASAQNGFLGRKGYRRRRR